tara:strand:- start:59332 stop:59781 length:450 start_codon:yes stop_codon:yes gene_type:complete
MAVNEAYNYKKWTENVDTSGVVSKEQLMQLSSEHYQAVISLLPDSSPHAVAGEKQLVEQQGLHYCYLPVDFAAPADSDYEQFESMLSKIQREKTLIHCAANYRVSAFAGIYSYKNLNWSAEKARQFMESLWDTREYPVWDQFVNRWLTE